MILKDLKEWVNKLPETMDEYVVCMRDIKFGEEDNTKMMFKDAPIISGVPDDQTQRLVFHDAESQVVINEFRKNNLPPQEEVKTKE
jgi:hypothetical protein